MTAGFPTREVYGLTSQMRRAAIPANIAEGFVRRGKADKARFMNVAEGSLEESRYYLILSEDFGYGNIARLMELLNEVGRMLSGYSRAIVASGFWLLASGSWLLAPCSLLLTSGSWLLAPGF
jgi:four helix bundle protein